MTVPKLLSKAWASNGLKNDIPADRSDGLPRESATYSEGFPQITMTPIAMGGKAPSGKDMNGVLNELSDHIVYQNKGGIYPFNAEFAEKIGGYPKGAILINDRLNLAFQSLVDNNKTNFNTQNYSGKWVVVFGNDFFVPKTQTATISRAGIVQLSNDDNSDDETKAPTLKAIKKLKGFYDGLRRLLDSYIPNSKKSNAVNSPSSETIATSAAVKSANDNANGRVSKSGDTMTGDLSIKNGEYSKLKLYNASGKEFRFESTPDSSQVFGKASYRSADGATEYYVQYFPKKSGTIALTNEVLLNSGTQSINGVLIAENVGSSWANYQWRANQGKWRLEVHPDSHTNSNRRFNMVWNPNSGNSVYLSFPHIGDNGETVAYQSWISQNYVKKSGDTMTGELKMEKRVVRFTKNGNLIGYVGAPNPESDYLRLSSNLDGYGYVELQNGKVVISKPLYVDGNRVPVSLSNHNIQFRWNNNGNLDLKVDNTELGNIHYTKKAYVYTTADNYGGIVIDRPSKNDRMIIESGGNKFTFIRRNLKTGSNHYAITTPEKGGMIALVEDFTNPTFTVTNNANNNASLNNISGTQFLSFGDGALNGLGLPGGSDWVGIQIADQGQQKTQIISGGYENHYIRTNDDLSKNVWHSERLLTDVTLQRLVNRRDYNRTIKGTNPNWDAGTSKNIAVTGYVVIYPDGKIEQYFYFRNFRIHWFLEEQARDGHHRIIEIPLQLWTAMPNKIEWVEAHISRTNDTNLWSQRTVGSEASEWTKPIWAFEKQGSIKDRLSLYTRRIYGDTNETVDMYIKIEGY